MTTKVIICYCKVCTRVRSAHFVPSKEDPDGKLAALSRSHHKGVDDWFEPHQKELLEQR